MASACARVKSGPSGTVSIVTRKASLPEFRPHRHTLLSPFHQEVLVFAEKLPNSFVSLATFCGERFSAVSRRRRRRRRGRTARNRRSGRTAPPRARLPRGPCPCLPIRRSAGRG